MTDAAALRWGFAGGRFAIFAGALLASGFLAFAPGSELGPGRLSAQIKVEGEVVDAASGIPIAGAIVHLPDVGVGTISDEMGYFALEAVPRGAQVVAVHRSGYASVEQEVRVVPGEVWEVRLTPAVVALEGIDVRALTGPEREAALTGRRSDFISPSTVAEAAERTNKVLEVMRSKAPPRLRIRQEGGYGGVSFCIESSRRRPSVIELMDMGTGCRPVLLAMDGVIVYSPPPGSEMAAAEPASLPADVAAIILNHNPQEIRSIRVLSPADAFFRYGEPGRQGAVEITTVHPGRPKGR